MTRLAIVVEGQTEREFVQRPLADLLLSKGVYLSAISLVLQPHILLTREYGLKFGSVLLRTETLVVAGRCDNTHD